MLFVEGVPNSALTGKGLSNRPLMTKKNLIPLMGKLWDCQITLFCLEKHKAIRKLVCLHYIPFKATPWCNSSLTAPSAGLFYPLTICSGWLHEWQLCCDWLFQEEAAMTQWMLHRISSTASAGNGPLSSLLSLSPSLFSPPVPLILSPPPLLSLLCPSSSSSSSKDGQEKQQQQKQADW